MATANATCRLLALTCLKNHTRTPQIEKQFKHQILPKDNKATEISQVPLFFIWTKKSEYFYEFPAQPTSSVSAPLRGFAYHEKD